MKKKDKLCLVCGQEIPESRTSNNVKYCSLKCARSAERKKRAGYISKRANNQNKIAQKVYTAYEGKCALCGWQISDKVLVINGKYQFAHGNEIHHITPAEEGGGEEENNVILLCPNHHKLADLGLIDREELRKHTRSLEKTPEEIAEMKFKVSDAIAKAIFG